MDGIEECIIKLFDELSHQYSYSDEFGKNIHYFNGWKTNKSWYINKKVIIPYVDAFDNFLGEYRPDNYYVIEKLRNIEKALDYLDGGRASDLSLVRILELAKRQSQTRKIVCKHFMVTFFKKGTCHLEFRDMDLLKKLNIYGCQKKGWLPQGYGKKTYSEMDAEEKSVIDSFEGERNYVNTVARADFYLFEPKQAVPRLTAA